MMEASPLVRQWILLRTLCARHHGTTVKELAAEMVVDEKTIRRDLEAFQTVGFPLSATVGSHGRKSYQIDRDKNQPGYGIEREANCEAEGDLRLIGQESEWRRGREARWPGGDFTRRRGVRGGGTGGREWKGKGRWGKEDDDRERARRNAKEQRDTQKMDQRVVAKYTKRVGVLL